MTWWYWLSLGLVLLAVEILTPGGFYLLFFGLAALLVGTIAGLGFVQPAWLQWLLFSLLSIVSVALFRGPLLRLVKSKTRTGDPVDSMVGEAAIVLDDLSPGAIGKAELRGAVWSVRNAGTIPLGKGQRSKVTQVDGLMLLITSE